MIFVLCLRFWPKEGQRFTRGRPERGSQWGGGFYGERLKFWLFTANGYFLSVTVNKNFKN